MTRIEEGNLIFEFGERWNVFKFDEHPDYRQGIGKLENTKAIDFLGVLGDTALFLIEVKDFRGHRIETKPRLTQGELSIELAQKVRDSLACIIASHRNSSSPTHWQPYAQLLHSKKATVKAVLWLEEDFPPSHPILRRKAMASTRTKLFKQKLTWLTTHVLVCGTGKQRLPEVTVKKKSFSQTP